MDTSKTRKIKSLLLQAWRERWTDIKWGINIKNVLPRGVSGDVYDLADCILQQALVGPGPNSLFLSYLTHCLSSHVVSYGAVLISIGRYQSFYKPYCIISLLDLLKSIQPRISCHYGNEEECIGLCQAVVNVTHWLYSCVLHSLSKLAELKQSPENMSILEKAVESLSFFSNSTFLKALLFVGKHEDQSMYSQLVQKQQELESKVTQLQGFNLSKDNIEVTLRLVKSVQDLPNISTKSTLSKSLRPQPIVCSLNALIAIDAVLSPASDIQACVDQLLLVQKLENLSLPEFYCEIIRACFMGLADAAGSSEDLKWAAFTFLKVPQFIAKVHKACKEDPSWNLGEDSAPLEQGLELLMQYTPLLDLTDTRSNCDCLQFLLHELCKVKLLSDAQYDRLLARRQRESLRQTLPRSDQQSSQAGASLILRAEPTVTSILKTLDSDYSKNQDALLGVLSHMNTGKSFELILSAAAATGKLHSFATKLIKFNEYNKENSGPPEDFKAAQTRALLFDITFLMLCLIAQQYGIEAVTSNPETKNSFFYTWVTECLAESGKYKNPDTVLSRCDSSVVDNLLSQFTNPDQEFRTTLVKWHEVCINGPMAIKEILVAWQYDALPTATVKNILDHVKSKMCCLPVCISAWLCNYVNILHHDERLKPVNMIQHFTTPYSGDGLGGMSSGQEQVNQYYKERSTLMINIIKKMMYDLHPPSQTKSKGVHAISQGLTVRTPLWEIMDGIFITAHGRGWLDLKTTHSLDTLMCVGGPQWFCDTLVRQALKFDHLDDLHRAVELIFGLFYIDIEQCALALLLHVLPIYIRSESRQHLLAEPHGSALARLVVLTIYAALQARQSANQHGGRSGRTKRPRRDMEMEEMYEIFDRERPSKIRRGVSDMELLDETPFGLQSNYEETRAMAWDPLNRAIADTMRMLSHIASDNFVSQRSTFPLLILEQLVLCAKEQANAVLQFMPLGLVPHMVKMMPEFFTFELVLAVSSLQTARARKVAARTLCQLDVARNA
ncbi:mediator of RNA polymerase II transcription subunit 24-like isoform X2 [Limulus polyphemus]|uniref:Mediator of RNA polymerase II transcription subunit 24 n=1 Tax=Limulus polyphemus TaxID=6850 RepID=A0ABM1TFS8_LIMPO|nr:mediator of RNA polymerase II transcription subunit 24-like isoform X2 [Limulus polyphemus]